MEKIVIEWLLEGDPAIRWQVMRDLLDAPESEWLAEHEGVAQAGWGQEFLSRQDPDGKWGGGLYSPKWVSTRYANKVFFHMEKLNQPSRWNTLRALRILRWAGK